MPSEQPERRLRDILENAERIRTYTDGMTPEAFEADRRTVDAVERCFERICEAARKLGSRYDAAYPEIDLPELRRFGSKLRHDYEEIAPRRIWAFLKRLDGLEDFARAEIHALRGDE